MFKQTMLVSVLCFAASQAHAGFWDTITSFFGSEKETQQAPAPEEAATKTETTTTAQVVKKGVELIPLLTQSLGVSQNQAQGGLGAILQAAQTLLSGTDFGTLANAIPNSQALLEKAPALMSSPKEEKSNLLDSALSVAAEHSDTAKTASQLIGQFKELGLSADMIPKFTQTTNEFLEQNDKAAASDLLMSSLGKLF